MYRKLALAGIVMAYTTGCVSNGLLPIKASSNVTAEQSHNHGQTVSASYETTPAYGTPIAAPATAQSNSNNAEFEITPGQCWVQTQIQSREMRYSAEIMVQEAQNKISVTPADMRRGYRQVVTSEGVKTYRIEPPVYRLVTEQVMVKPELTRFDVIPAVYEDREVEIVVTPAKTVLEPCRAAGVSFSQTAAPQSFCAKEIPAKTERVMQRIVVQDEQTQVRFDPAVYETVTRRVVDRPARAIEILTDDIVESIPVQEVVSQEQTEIIQIPAITREMQLTEFDGAPRIVARQALCNTDVNDDLVRNLQSSLAEKGYNPGPHDGKLGPNTIQALERFQMENGLGIGALTLESLDSLGVDYR